MKENNLQKKSRNAKEYANLFLLDENGKKRDFSNVNSVCLVTIGHAETLWILLQVFVSKDITIIDRKSEIDFIEALKKLHKRNDIRIVQKIEVENEDAVSSTILNLNMSFDLVIANPPYGKSSSLAQQIIDTVKTCAKQSIWLVPVNTCKYDEVLKSCESVNVLSRTDSNLFEGATTGRLSLLKINPEINNSSLIYEDLILNTLDKKLVELRKATKAYNEKIGTKSIYTIDGTYLLKKYNKTLKEASKQTLPKTFESIVNRNVKDLRNEGYCFYNTVRSTVDGVHFTDGYDRRYNFEGIWDNKVDTVRSGDLLCFESKEARNNFRDWWYSCTKKYANKVECNRRGLTNMYLTLLGNCVSWSAGIGYYIDYFPQVDWSHPWTDKEILKEIGLSEDFLEKE